MGLETMSFSFPSTKEIDESWWGKQYIAREYDPRQLQIEYFFPLTEQIALPLDFEGCDTKPKLTTLSCETGGITWSTVSTNIAPQLTIDPIDSVGQLSIGGIRVGLEKKPSWAQRQLHKLLGFNWKDK